MEGGRKAGDLLGGWGGGCGHGVGREGGLSLTCIPSEMNEMKGFMVDIVPNTIIIKNKKLESLSKMNKFC